MNRTISDKIIDDHTISDNFSSKFRRVKIDLLLGHDATIALLVDQFEEKNLKIWDTERVLFTNDHFSPPSTAEQADISHKFLYFARNKNVKNLMLDKGICHQLLVEHRLCRPGALIVGADSHTIMGGALGACATGMGSTDILFALATGTTWLQKPSTICVQLTGQLPSNCSGRDVVLALLGIFGEDGAQYQSLEFHDMSQPKLCQTDRFAISNMAVEMGAKFGIFEPDDITFEYCEKRDGSHVIELINADRNAHYSQVVQLNLSELSPMIAKPWSPANVVALSEIEEISINTAFLGSCSCGRLEDIAEALDAIGDKSVHPNVRFIIIPASMKVYEQALELGYVLKLTKAGAVFNQTSCGPCGGIDKGVLGKNDVCVSTSNRNFRGRMGDWNSRTYLASARTVAKAAVQGKISPKLYSM